MPLTTVQEEMLSCAQLTPALKRELACKEFVLQYIPRHLSKFRCLSRAMREDKDVVLAAVATRSAAYVLSSVSGSFLHDRDVMLTALMHGDTFDKIANQVHQDLRDDCEFAAAAVVHEARFAACMSARLRRDRDAMMRLAVANADVLHYARDFVDDRDFMMTVVQNAGYAFKYASSRLKKDDALARAACANDGRALAYASRRVRAERGTVLAAAATAGYIALQLASPKHRADREIVLTAAKNDGTALEFAAAPLRYDREIAVAALRSGKGWAHMLMPQVIREDPALLLQVPLATFRTGGDVADLVAALDRDVRTRVAAAREGLADHARLVELEAALPAIAAVIDADRRFPQANREAWSATVDALAAELHEPAGYLATQVHKRAFEEAFA